MFYSNRINAYKQLIIATRRYWLGNFPFVFFEDLNEIASVVKQPYENLSSFVANTGDDGSGELAIPEKQSSFAIFNLIVLLQASGGFRPGIASMFRDLDSAYYFTLSHKNTIFVKDTSLTVSQLHSYQSLGYHLYYVVDNYEYSPTFFLQTFDTSFWLYFIGFTLVIIGCFATVTKLLKQSNISPFDVISLILSNSIKTVNRTVSFCVLFISFLILLVIFYAAFGALLDVLLAIRRTNIPFNDLNELLLMPDYTICMIDQVTPIWFKIVRLKNQIGGKASINSEHCPNIHPITHHWINDFAFQCNWKKTAFYFTEKESSYERFLIKRCNLTKFPGVFFTEQVTFSTSLEFAYKEILNQKIILARTSGNLDYVINTAYVNHFSLWLDRPMTGHGLVQIEFEHCKLIILSLLIGMIASVLILAAEKFMKKSKKLPVENTLTKVSSI